jgi:hypothetical protein
MFLISGSSRYTMQYCSRVIAGAFSTMLSIASSRSMLRVMRNWISYTLASSLLHLRKRLSSFRLSRALVAWQASMLIAALASTEISRGAFE